jgi:hypothetical protein
VLEINKELYELFKKSSTPAGIADALIQKSPFMRIYASYCSNQENALQNISKLKEANPKFDAFLQVAHARPESLSLDLDSYLIKPGLNCS